MADPIVPIVPVILPRNSKAFTWAVLALIGACPVVTALFIWIMIEVLHGAWPLRMEIVLKRLDIVGTAVIGLLAMLGVLVTAIVVAAIKANIKASGPGGIGLDISQQTDAPAVPTTAVVTTTTVTPTPTSTEGN